SHRTSRARVLRKAHRRTQAQARGGRQASLQAPAQPAAAAQALLTTHSTAVQAARGEGIRPSLFPESPMTLKTQITEDMKTAMRAKDTARLSTIRLLLAAIKQREVDERIELTDADVLSV